MSEEDQEWEEDEEEWTAPFQDAFDEATQTFPYGALSKMAPVVASPDGVSRRVVEMVNEASATPVKLFIDVGCGQGKVLNHMAVHIGCQTLGVDISVKELEVAASQACELGVAHLCNYVECDFRAFDTHIPEGVEPKDMVVYMYSIPYMVNHPELRKVMLGLLEKGATVVTWCHHATPTWPYMKHEDEVFRLRLFQKTKEV